MVLAFVMALFIFVHMETLRRCINKHSQLNMLNKFMIQFIDSKDSKQLILSHTYLLIGCLWPLVYANQYKMNNSCYKLTGLISLCISDSLVY